MLVVLCGAMDRGGYFCASIEGVRQVKQAGSGSNPPTRRSQPRLTAACGWIRSRTVFSPLLLYVDLNHELKINLNPTSSGVRFPKQAGSNPPTWPIHPACGWIRSRLFASFGYILLAFVLYDKRNSYLKYPRKSSWTKGGG